MEGTNRNENEVEEDNNINKQLERNKKKKYKKKSRKVVVKRFETNTDSLYDSEEEKELLVQEETNYLKKLIENENQNENKNDNDNHSNIMYNSNHNSPNKGDINEIISNINNNCNSTNSNSSDDITDDNNSNNNTTTTTTATPTLRFPPRTLPIIHINPNLFQNIPNEPRGEAQIHINESGQEMGHEAFELLQIQSAMTAKLHFNGFTKRASIISILYFTFVNSLIFIVLKMDWNRSCQYPFKMWSIVQFIIQSLILLNFVYISFSLPDEDDENQTSPFIEKVHSRFKLIHRFLIILIFSWFFVGSVWVSKSSNNQCYAKIPYLYGLVYSLVIFELLTMVLSIILIILNLILKFLKDYLSRNQIVNTQDNNGDINPIDLLSPKEPRGASDAMIRNLKVNRFKEGLLPTEDCACAICLCDYVEDDRIRILPCKHHYHLECIDRWLIINKACPFCKRDIASHNDFIDKIPVNSASDLI